MESWKHKYGHVFNAICPAVPQPLVAHPWLTFVLFSSVSLPTDSASGAGLASPELLRVREECLRRGRFSAWSPLWGVGRGLEDQSLCIWETTFPWPPVLSCQVLSGRAGDPLAFLPAWDQALLTLLPSWTFDASFSSLSSNGLQQQQGLRVPQPSAGVLRSLKT